MLTPVLATVILDPTTALIGGAAIALFSTLLIRKNPTVELNRTALLGALWGLWYGLSVGYMYFNYTDWMLAYLMDAKAISVPLTYAVFVAVLVLHGYLAALGVGALVLHRKLGLAIAVLVGVSVTNLLLMGLQAHAYNHIGTFAQYAAGTAPEIANEARAQFGMTLSGVMSVVGAAVVLTARFVAGRRKSAAAPAAGAATA